MQNQHQQTKAVLIAQGLDRQINQFIRLSFTNRALLNKTSIGEQIQAYKDYGQHKLDFSKVYDI